MTTDYWMRTMIVVIATIAIFAALYFASSVFAPVACAVFIIALTWPLQVRLQSRIPQLIALAIVIGITVAVFFVFSSIVAWAFGRVGRSLVAETQYFQSLYEQVTLWLEGHGIIVAKLWSEHFNVRWFIRTLQGISGRVNTTISFWLVVVVYVILGLLEVGAIARKVASVMHKDVARIIIDGSAMTAAKFRRYMLIRTLMSVATGALVWTLATVSGLQLATEWGVIAFALNYIPFIGPFIATVFPTLFALAQFASWQSALVVFACLNVIQFVIGSYIEPRVAGNALSISPFVVLFSVFFWTFVWGLFGAFIGVPITIALLTFCAQHPSSRWIAELLGGPAERAAR
jgi:AI-2 transport protein TqsA